MENDQSFKQLGIQPDILKALDQLGYETPSPVQTQSIPPLLRGQDIMAQAQTGTGKTAAFALPILNNINLKNNTPQALILAPTRELAIQVAEALQSYAKYLRGFHVLPIYGGQEYSTQLRALKRGVHIIVGTPGRVMDHLRRKTLKTETLKTLVLDEADEMLRMGFIEDVQWILEQIKNQHQTALFSATIPPSIKNIAKRFLHNPAKIHINPKKTTVKSINQFYMLVNKNDKLEALTRYLEIEHIDSAIIFTGTKTFSAEMAEKLGARGYAAAALHGDMSQNLREKVIARLKNSQLDIVVATEVAARGLDVERISHVINLDIPRDAESYIHRIGRTGRAGRSGKALLFVTPREQRMLREIESAVGSEIKVIKPPSAKQIKNKHNKQLLDNIQATIDKNNLDFYRNTLQEFIDKEDLELLDVAAAIAHISQIDKNLPQGDIAEVQFEKQATRRKSYRQRNPKKRFSRKRSR